MAKIDLDSLSIEELAGLRDHATEKLSKRSRHGRPNSRRNWKNCPQYGKPAKKSPAAAPVAKAKKSDEKKSDEVKEPIAKAA